VKKQVKISLQKVKVESFVTSMTTQEFFTINGGKNRPGQYGLALKDADILADNTIVVVNSNYCNSEPGVDCHAFTSLCSTDVHGTI
jgi:hypothetical protein